MKQSAPPAFEIGLVMAGAASAGAYTAGVVDYLIEALQAWENAKVAGDLRVPDHVVRLRVAAGASAGGIVGALLSMLPFTGHFPVTDLADASAATDVANGERNLLYRSWVLRTDVSQLLTTDDLRGRPPKVWSLLNGRVLTEIAEEAVASVRAAMPAPAVPPSYFANPLQLYLSLTNMRGISYVIRMIADERMRGHAVRSHCDYAHFALLGTGAGPAEPLPPGAIPVNRPDAADGWDAVRDAALATSAFPCGFPVRPFHNPKHVYRERVFGGQATAASGKVSVAVDMDLPQDDGDSCLLWCVDGGLLNNEPLEYAHWALLNGTSRPPSTDGRRADRSLLLVDPFPNDTGRPGGTRSDQAPDVLDSLFALIPMLRSHAAFKPQELAVAFDEEIRNRYLITPVRETALPQQTELASAGLAGFAGFLHEQLRMHDFQLGRRNCQKFLRDHFHLHVDNPLVRNWVQRMRAEGGIPSQYHPGQLDPNGCRELRTDLVQIIPQVDAVRRDVMLRPWPKLDREQDFEPIRRLILRRADSTVPELMRALLTRAGVGDRRLVNRALRAIACDMITSRVGQSAADAIERDLTMRGLL